MSAALAGVITAGVVGATLLLLTPIFEKMPLNALGAIVIASILNLVQYNECAFLWKVRLLNIPTRACNMNLASFGLRFLLNRYM